MDHGQVLPDRWVAPLVLPSRPHEPEKAPFPLVASIAPVVAAAAIWAVTRSPFALVFAALGPIVAIASLLDSRRHAVRRRRREAARYVSSITALRVEMAEAHERERCEAWRRTPSATMLIACARDDPERWHARSPGRAVLGRGTIASMLRLDGSVVSDLERELRDVVAFLEDAPLSCEAGEGIGVVGPSPLARAALRGLLLQLCRSSDPSVVRIEVPSTKEWEWAAGLPHATGPMVADGGARRTGEHAQENIGAARPGSATIQEPERWIVVRDLTDGGSGPSEPFEADVGRVTLLVAATTGEQLPPGCGTVLRVDGVRRGRVVRSRDGFAGTIVVPEFIGREQAAGFARDLREMAAAAGLGLRREALPDRVVFEELVEVSSAGSGETVGRDLSCPLGRTRRGHIVVDLVGQGPHALIGGTTGSGKSELLVTWIASMASRHSTRELTVLLVDFKGGSSFAQLAELPHCVGVITDLDEREASRALASLRAELRFREEQLRQYGARDIADAELGGRLPRLVIVVDEFAAMLGLFPELHALFVDLAARGRSLGVHLVLCTQRPAGIVRDALLANCNLRLSLRVNNRSDSLAVIGTEEAARIAPDNPGRCFLDTGSGRTIEFQAAVTVSADIRHIVETTRSSEVASPELRRPWLDPLPRRLPRNDARLRAAMFDGEQPGILLGLLDDPERQRQNAAVWIPERHGHLLLLGGPGTGKTSLLAAIHEHGGGYSVDAIAPDPESLWDALVDAARQDGPDSVPRKGRVLLLDDWDSVSARWPSDHRQAGIELLLRVLRDGPAARRHVVLASQRLTGQLQSARPSFGSAVILRLADRSDHLLAGGRPEYWDTSDPPGSGEWRGLRMQCVLPTQPPPAAVARVQNAPDLEPSDGPLLVVSSSPTRTAEGLRRDGFEVSELSPLSRATANTTGFRGITVADSARKTALVGDLDAWQANWSLFSSLRGDCGLVFDGGSLADYRLLTRRRELPPVLAAETDHGWLVTPDGVTHRRRIRR
ncbi:FtsK/SpoIIIE domain-containing protein [Luethyella okanaganae]|uniref:FtsK/SpoIIIE domain-containing protein n=1 Tax=Luethyella okanaganae TaxID=69372 RepID=A0ABW1VIK0_9MICO